MRDRNCKLNLKIDQCYFGGLPHFGQLSLKRDTKFENSLTYFASECIMLPRNLR